MLINLVGIKLERAPMSFERAHVGLPLELAALAEGAGFEHMIHISVAGAQRPIEEAADHSAYLASKARGDAALRAREGALPLTILRPGVVYGPGDDMLRKLADSIRAAPLFPAPGRGLAPIAALAVEDLAEAVLRCVEAPPGPSTVRAYDLVGPEQLSLREILARVAAHPRVDRGCWVVPAPIAAQRVVARVLEASSTDPLITRSQLELLRHGVVGDNEPARRDFALEPRPLDDAAIEAALAHFEPRLPSVRLVPDPAASELLGELAGRVSPTRLIAFAVIAVLALLLGPALPASIWARMAGLELLLSLLALAGIGAAWAKLWRPSWSGLSWGLGAGLVMVAGAHLVAAVLGQLAPQLWSEAAGIYAWATQLPLASALALLTIIVAGEELVWRGALGLVLASRLGPWAAVAGSALLFTLAHLTTGPPLLALAAALAGAAWTALAIRSRSLFASFVAHFAWDVATLWIVPLL